MKVMLFTHDGPIYMPVYLEPVLEKRAEDITDVVLAATPGSFLDDTKEKYEMFGPKAFVKFGFLYARGMLLDALPGSLGRSLTGRYHSVRSLAEAHDVPVREVPDVNEDAFVNFVRERDPDLILSIACSQRIDEELLDIPDEGAVNIHGSLLPKYRGLTTSFWVLYHGETENGVTAHYMTPEFDAGGIIHQRRYDIEPDDSMHDVYWKLVDIGADVAIEAIDQIESGDVETTPNPLEEGEYYSRPTKKEREEFLRRGNEFI